MSLFSSRFCAPFRVYLTSSYTAGSPRVEGDEEEDDIDDLEHEFDYGNFDGLSPEQVAEAMLSSRMNTGRDISGIPTHGELDSSPLSSKIPLLTYGEEVIQFAIVMCKQTNTQVVK